MADTSPVAAPAPSELRQSLEAKDAVFTKLLSLIPAKYYIVDTPEEADSKWMKNKKKRSAEEVTQTRKKAKFEKFDPENNKTVPEIQAERAALLKQENGIALPPTVMPMQPTVSVSTLRQKLQDKIDSLSKKRGGVAASSVADVKGKGKGKGKVEAEEDEDDIDMDGSDSDSDDEDDDEPSGEDDGSISDSVNGTLASRDEMLEARRRRAGEVRDNRRRKRKAERKAEREAQEKGKKKGKKGGKEEGKDGKKVDFSTKTGKTGLIVNPKFDSKPSTSLLPESNISFPSLSLPSASSSSSSKQHTHLKHISNPTQALAHLQAQNERLKNMPEEKRKEIEEKERWGRMVERAEGGKVRDDETRLKKAERRMEKEKAKSGSEWQDRKKQLAQSQAIKAKKRNENISNKIEARKNKKLGIKPKGDKEKGKGGSGGGHGKGKGGGFGGKDKGGKGKGKGKPGF